MAESHLLKKDLFGEIRRFSTVDGYTIVRDSESASLWLRWLARRLMRREASNLRALGDVPGVPRLLSHDRDRLHRSYIDGAPMQEARPRDPVFFRRAFRNLRLMHRSGVVHNDLAKEPNILVTSEGRPAFIDFQLAIRSARRGRLFRALAYDDIRHLLKHKRSYCPDALTARQKRILAAPSLPALAWMRTGKPVYLFVTRRLLGWADREGAADRGRLN